MKNMPPITNNSWYFDKKELKSTPSIIDGLDYETELRYRREGARLILDIGTRMGLRFDTIWTGVVYFHRFYMFRSFKDFKRYVTATCCLFLAGKVEETPKKCKDLIQHARNLLDEVKFAQFGESPREEVMTLERILLQTMNFDLQVDHAYSYLLKFAKHIKNVNDEKKQKMVQMAWTFINDSLQTTLHLQWEPDVVAVALMFLASRLTKLEIKDWVNRDPSVKMKWFEAFVEGVTQPLLEDICHQVLDLYSSVPQKSSETRSPNQPAGGTPSSAGHTPSSAGQTPTQTSSTSRGGGVTSSSSSHAQPPAHVNPPPPSNSHGSSSSSSAASGGQHHHSNQSMSSSHSRGGGAGAMASEPASRSTSAANTPQRSGVVANSFSRGEDPYQAPAASSAAAAAQEHGGAFNPYVSHYSASSFLNSEGQKTIASLLSGGGGGGQPSSRTHPSHHRHQNPPQPQQPHQSAPPPPPNAASSCGIPPVPHGYLPTASYHAASSAPPPPPVGAPPSADYHHSHPYSSYPPQPPPPSYALPPPGYAGAPPGAPAPGGVYYTPVPPPSHPVYPGAPLPQQLPYAPPGLPPVHHHPGSYPYHPPPPTHGYAAPPASHM